MVDRSPGFFDVDLRLADLSVKGDDRERVKALVDFEISARHWKRQFRALTVQGAAGRPSITC